MSRNQPSISEKVLARIKEEQICPARRGWFTCLECFVWATWLLAVIVGALAVAVITYIGINGWYGFYEATDMSRIGMALNYVPLVWIVVLVLTAVLALRNMRQTKRGYRYPAWLLLTSSIGLSVVIGFVLYALGFGFITDTKLGESMPQYTSYVTQQEQFWSAPESNRWLGVVTETNGMVFADIAGERWTLDVANVLPAETALLMDGDRVRLVGLKDEASNVITVCAVLPWHHDSPLSSRALADDKLQLVSRLATFKTASSSCAQMGILERMP